MAKNIFAALLLALLLCGCGGSSTHPVTLVSITVTPQTVSIVAGTTTQFRAAGNFSDGSSVDITGTVAWSSSDTTVATINSQGVALAANTVGATSTSTIKAISGGISGTATLTIATVQSITVSPAIPGVDLVGSTQPFSATGHFSNGDVQVLTSLVTWNTSNQAIATISPAGVATGVGSGTAQITATLGSVSSLPVNLTVRSLQSIAVTSPATSLDAGASQQFTATGTLSDASSLDLTSKVTWVSLNPAVVAIDANGVASALSPGSTSIGASFLGTSSIPVGVTVQPPTSIAVTPALISAVAGSTQQFTATGTFADLVTHDLTNLVTWASSLTAIATISNATGSRGLATAGVNGSTTISAALGNASGSASLSVKTLASISVTPANPSIPIGSTTQMTATGTFSDGTTQDLTGTVTWSSAPPVPSVITVSNLAGTKGLVSALGLGSAAVTATLGGKSGSSTVTVSPINLAYVTNFGGGTLSVIDTLHGTLITNIAVGPGPQSVAVNPAINRAYVASNSGTLSVVDITSNTVVATVNVGAGPWGVALFPAANRVYVTNSFSGTLSVVDTSSNPTTSNTVVATVVVGTAPKGVAVDPATSRVYVTNSGDNTVSVVDAVRNLVIPPVINVGTAPQNIALDSGSSRAYVANGFSNILSVINIATNAVTPVAAGTIHQGIAINPSTNRVYVANSDTGTVSVIDTTKNAELATHSPIQVGTNPQGIAVKTAASQVFVANSGSNTVTVINTSSDSNSIFATIPVGNSPRDIAVLP